jgi:hypothetical protein
MCLIGALQPCKRIVVVALAGVDTSDNEVSMRFRDRLDFLQLRLRFVVSL